MGRNRIVAYTFFVIWGFGFGGIPLMIMLTNIASDEIEFTEIAFLSLFVIIGMGAFFMGLIGLLHIAGFKLSKDSTDVVVLDVREDKSISVNGSYEAIVTVGYIKDGRIVYKDIYTKDTDAARYVLGKTMRMKGFRGKYLLDPSIIIDNDLYRKDDIEEKYAKDHHLSTVSECPSCGAQVTLIRGVGECPYCGRELSSRKPRGRRFGSTQNDRRN